MASEIRVNRLSNRSGLSTITFANGGVQFSGITTFANGEFYVGTGATIINPSSNEFNFHTGGSNRFTINNSGANLGTGNITAVDATFTGNVSIGKTLTYEDVKNVDSVGVVTARTGVKVTGGDLTVGTAITASSVTGNVTQDVGITTFSGSATWFKGTTANKDMYWSKSSGSLIFKDTAAALFGDSSDLQISHDGSNSYIKDSGTGGLRLCADEFNVKNAANNQVIIRGTQGSGVELYNNNSKKFETTADGIEVTGKIFPSSHIDMADNVKLLIGTSDDLEVYHDSGGNSYIKETGGGSLVINADDFYLQNNATTTFLRTHSAGAIDLNHSGNKKLETTSTGVTVTGDMNISDGTGQSHYQITQTNGNTVKFGIVSGSDIELSGASNNSMYFKTNNTERLRIASDGKIGIGIASPDSLLHLEGSGDTAKIKLQRTGTTIGGSINARDGSNDKGLTYLAKDGNSGYPMHVFQTDGGSGATERMRITHNGQLSIGAAQPTFNSPQPLLNIEKTSTGTGPLIFLYNHQSATLASTCEIRVGQNYREANRIVFGRENNSNWQSSAASTASYMGFHTNNAGTISEKLRITAGGEILIGRYTWGSNVFHPNDINKVVITGTSPADSYDSQLYLEGSETSGAINTGGALAFGGHNGSTYRNWANIYGMKENGTGGNNAAYMSFHTRPSGGGPTERLRITSDGQIQKTQGANVSSLKTYNSNAEGFWLDHYQFQDAGTYRRYADIVSKGDTSWGSHIRVFGNDDSSGNAIERLHMNEKGYWYPTPGGGCIMGVWKYKQTNQSQNYEHIIRGPYGNSIATDMDGNSFFYIEVAVHGTGTGDAWCEYHCDWNSSETGATLTHVRGNNDASSNRPYMVLNNNQPYWKMNHNGGYTMDIKVSMMGGKTEVTYTGHGAYTSNP